MQREREEYVESRKRTSGSQTSAAPSASPLTLLLTWGAGDAYNAVDLPFEISAKPLASFTPFRVPLWGTVSVDSDLSNRCGGGRFSVGSDGRHARAVHRHVEEVGLSGVRSDCV